MAVYWLPPVEVGQRYVGWGKLWEVTRVWEAEGVAEIRNVNDDANTGRYPLSQFRTMEPALDDAAEARLLDDIATDREKHKT